tara:strand:- start:134 stop:2359 length:2226 start_codon:yes stop_codon:yes gene_type:complete
LATFETQVEALTGITIDGSSNPTQTELSVFLQDGVKDVIHRMIEVRPEELARFCSTTDSGVNTFVAKVGKILSVVREHDSPSILRRCIEISPGDRYDATDVDSLNYRSKTNPGFYELDGKIYTIPAAAASGDNNVVVTQLFYDTGVAHGDEVPDNFPESYAYLVALYGAIRSLQASMAAKAAPSVPVSQSVPILNITATDPTAISLTTVNYNPVIASTSTVLTSLTAPTYTKPTTSLVPAPSLTAVTFNSIDSALDASAPVFSTATVSTASTYTGSAPEYTKPTLVLGAAPTISNLDISAVPPDTPSLSSITFSGFGAVDASLVQVAASTTLTGANATTNVPTYTPPVIGGETEELTDTMGTGSSKTDFSDWFDQVGDYIETDEDVELAGAQLQKIASYIGSYNAAMTNQLNEFNEANVKFQASVQESMAEFQLANQISIANAERSQNRQLQNSINDMKVLFDSNAQAIQKYNSELQSYQAEVSAQVQEYQQNLAGDMQVWQAERQTDLTKYSTDVQNEVNEYNKENTVYQSAIQESMQEVQIANQVNLAKAQADLQLALNNEERDQQRQLQNGASDMQAIVDDNNRKIASWQGERTTDLQKYSTDIQNELNEFNKENASFTYEVQKALADAQSANQVSLQNGSQEARDAVENNNAQVTRFQAMSQHYGTQVNEDVQKYTAEIQALSADIQASVSEHVAELQGTQAEYQWRQDQYMRLKAEYDQAFMMAAPQQQAAQGAAG